MSWEIMIHRAAYKADSYGTAHTDAHFRKHTWKVQWGGGLLREAQRGICGCCSKDDFISMKTREVHIICNATHLIDCVVHMWMTGFVKHKSPRWKQAGLHWSAGLCWRCGWIKLYCMTGVHHENEFNTCASQDSLISVMIRHPDNAFSSTCAQSQVL